MELGKYLKIKEELENKKRLLTALRESGAPTLQDSVKGSLPYFPYSETNFHLEGKANYSYTDGEIERLSVEIEELTGKLKDAEAELIAHIEKIEDPTKQIVIRCRYLYGFSTYKIADIVDHDQSWVAKTLKVYRA